MNPKGKSTCSRTLVDRSRRACRNSSGVNIDYIVGTRNRVTAQPPDVPEPTSRKQAEPVFFFSFGQRHSPRPARHLARRLGLVFIEATRAKEIVAQDPFVSSIGGAGRADPHRQRARPQGPPRLKLAIAADENGGDPASIQFCQTVGPAMNLNYISCSPYRYR